MLGGFILHKHLVPVFFFNKHVGYMPFSCVRIIKSDEGGSRTQKKSVLTEILTERQCGFIRRLISAGAALDAGH